ncbi:MAG: hypothetical protein KGM42_15740 [Hyphomicrobiales bacterium]|nr:hypothetical protein [Hyphomicrobiales bacterium]
MRTDKAVAKAAPMENGAADADTIDQVRELLFGATKRTTEARLDDIDRQIALLRDDLAARFASLEARLAEQGRDTDSKHNRSIDNIGQAIAELGATIKALGTGGKAR